MDLLMFVAVLFAYLGAPALLAGALSGIAVRRWTGDTFLSIALGSVVTAFLVMLLVVVFSELGYGPR